MRLSHTILSGLLASEAQAQLAGFAQCGGPNWTGGITCVTGFYCLYQSQWYSQCVPGIASTTAEATTTLVTSTTTKAAMSSSTSRTSSAAPPTSTGSGKFKWFGINESGAEFGQATLPGVWGTHFTFPANSALDTLISSGYNIFRVPFAMERLAPSGISAAFGPAYLANLTATVNYITSKGAYAVLDPHNYGRYNGAIIADVSSFKTFWTNLANAFKGNGKVIFDTNNEYHDMDQTLVLNLNQGAIEAIRAAGAVSQYIFVEGNSYSGAWTWTTVNDNLKALTDPQNKIIYEMHQYLDSDGSGTSTACVSSTIGAERLTAATKWLKDNKKMGIIGEFAGGANNQCASAVKGMLDYMKKNTDVWTGAMWWGGGPWWGDYIYGFEPPKSIGYDYYDRSLRAYAPGL
ncbi:probable cellulase precursor [Rhynchosporium secalis]|uniref:cellulase n=1 Tax=Rhynchosporium secalis TaxID=38038 RepID=A0A1E1MUR1_RHYSE|nr:probable cellulase precursor [Rhynchosporium secalis]